MASSHSRAWSCHSNVHRGRPCSSRTRAACSPFCQRFGPLTHRLPCPLFLTAAAIVTVCFQQREGEEKPLWVFGSVQERLMAGVRVWTREPAVSMCCQQSWPDSCCTSCALHVLVAQRRWRGHFENKGFQLPRYPLTPESLRLPGQSIIALAPTSLPVFRLFQEKATHLARCQKETQDEFRCGGAQLRGVQSFFMTCLLLDSCCHPKKGQIKVIEFQKSNSQNSVAIPILSLCSVVT